MGRQFLAPGGAGIRTRLLVPLAIIALLAALFASGVVTPAHASPVVQNWDIVGVHQFQVCTSSTPCTSSSPDIIGTGTMTVSTEDPVSGELTGYADIYVNGHHIHVPATAVLNGNALGNFQPDPVEGWTIDGHDQSERPTWDVSGGFLDGTIDPSTGLFSGGAYVTYDAPDGDGSLIGPLGIDFSPLDVYCSTTCYVNGSTGSDLTGDGSQAHPFATIQEGVEVVNDYGTVIVAAGTYNESVNVDHPVTLKGYKAGWDARYRTPSFGGETIVQSPDSVAFQVNASDVTIDGFTMANSGAGFLGSLGYDDITIVNDIFRNNSAGIFFSEEGIWGLTIQHNLFDHNNLETEAPISGVGIYVDATGIYPYESSPSLIDANAFTGNATGGLVMTQYSYAYGLQISNNSSKNDGSFAVLYGVESSAVVNNTVANSTSDAIVLKGQGDDGIYIQGNTITSAAGAGILVDDPPPTNNNIIVTGNTFNMDQYGLHVENNLAPGSNGSALNVTKNIFKASKIAAIAVDAGVDTSGISVNDNSIAGNFAGIINANEDQFDATCNWWGTNSGPRSINNPGGYGDSVSGLDRDSFAPWLTSSNLNFPCDGTAPTVTIVTPTNGATYRLHQAVRPIFSCADTGGSGIASCTVTEGGSNYAVDTSTSGTGQTFTVTATDKAGNTTFATITYNVT